MFGGDNKTAETKKPEKSERELRIENFDRSVKATIDRFWGDKEKNSDVDRLGAVTVNAEGTWETDEEKLDKDTFESFSQVIRFAIINNPNAEIFDLVSQLYDKPEIVDQMKLGIDLILSRKNDGADRLDYLKQFAVFPIDNEIAEHLINRSIKSAQHEKEITKTELVGEKLKKLEEIRKAISRLEKFAEKFQTELINKNPTEEIPEATEVIEEADNNNEAEEKEVA